MTQFYFVALAYIIQISLRKFKQINRFVKQGFSI